MSMPKILAVTARTISLIVVPDGAKFTLPQHLDWVLTDAAGATVQSGSSDRVGIFLEGLHPETTYDFKCDLGSLQIKTPACTGLVDASDYGASPDSSDNSHALQKAIRAVPEGGTLRVRPGTFNTAPLFLKPNMTLLLERGCRLSAIGNRAAWPILNALDENGRTLGSWEGLPDSSHAALVTAIDCHNLTITGAGVIDGGGDTGDWWQWPKETRNGARRPRTVHLAYCNDVVLSGVTICNSPSWTVHPYLCENLHCSNLSIQNPPNSPNTDGLNPESCKSVTLTALHFSVGDDCIAIKAGKRGTGKNLHLAPTRDIVIQHCLMERGHGAVVIGSEMSGGIHDVTISKCQFLATDRGLRIKTRRGRGGEVSDIHLTDVDMVDVPTPLAINAFYFCDPDGKADWVQTRTPAPVDETTPSIRNITMKRVTAQGVTTAAAAVLGLPEAPVTGVQLCDVAVSYAANATPDVPLMSLSVPSMRHASVWAEFANVDGSITEIDFEKDPTLC
ncbi:MAG: glycoside hydrolase family 28 protein [Pelagimonas sp.]|uniref:polygalacturonase PglA n=1 Tax=Pelagimonas sp. TaxID=2073170 RepID=UPI003D6A7DB6